MRVLVAPDKFAGTLSAVAAAEAIAEGWGRSAPTDELDLAPVADGGPGFIEVLETATGGRSRLVTVTGPLGEPVDATVLLLGDTAYLEAAQACGLHLVPDEYRDPTVVSTYGVGELLAAAVEEGARRCVIGLGGSATNDGGSGMLAALGGRPYTSPWVRPLAPLESVSPQEDVAEVADILERARNRVRGREIIAATDVDNPLLGQHGASVIFGPQKGARPADITRLEDALRRWAELTDGQPPQAACGGAGAAGGLGYGLFLLGASRESGIEAVLDAIRLDERVARADLVITGEGSFDAQSLRGKAVSGVAHAASRQGRACLVLAGQVGVPRDEMRAAGVRVAYALVDSAGSAQAAMAEPFRELATLAERSVSRWSADEYGG